MSFKEMIEADNHGVFLNSAEFAEKHIVKYDGEMYCGDDGSGISVLLIKTKELKRPITVSNNMQGIHIVTATAYMSLADLGGNQPEQKRVIYISDGEALGETYYRGYRIVTSDCEMGMVSLELEAYDE